MSLQRQRETSSLRILYYCVWVVIVLVFVGKIGGNPETGLLTLLGFLLELFIFLLPIFLYNRMGHQTHATWVSALFSVFWAVLFFLIDAMLYRGSDPMATAAILIHTFSLLRTGTFFPPSDQRHKKSFQDGGTL